ncbi:MAG: hypothetical protein LKE40_08580 [Spirochaetia bacterium]|jgi:hypothetical protein|nr:hypothetical protein [Spirochaetia bacterium]
MTDREKLLIDNIIQESDGFFNQEDGEGVYASVCGHLNFLRKDVGQFVTFDDACFSWMENIFLPLHNALKNSPHAIGFPKKKMGKLFFEICDNWYYMSQLDPSTTADEAVINYYKNFASTVGRVLINAYTVA